MKISGDGEDGDEADVTLAPVGQNPVGPARYRPLGGTSGLQIQQRSLSLWDSPPVVAPKVEKMLPFDESSLSTGGKERRTLELKIQYEEVIVIIL